ncbi:MAG: TetR family transcriptional regulator, partial [Lautropia sp.]
AAAKVVGSEGYANASVAKITAHADVSQGTFYNYFASQQDLFDHLLPEIGSELLDFIRERVTNCVQSQQREEIGFRAFFEFLAQRPEFYRILNEAETFAPAAFHDHMRNMADGYVRALNRSRSKGEIPGFEPRELEVVVYSLLAARNYLSYRYMFRDGVLGQLPEWVVKAYLKLVSGGMLYGGTSVRTYRPRRSATEEKPSRGEFDYHFARVSNGKAIATLEAGDEHRDANGIVRRSVLMGFLDATGLRAASTVMKPEPRLVSMTSSFLAAASGDRFISTAEIEHVASPLHVRVRIEEQRDGVRGGRPIVTALAVFAASDPGEQS